MSKIELVSFKLCPFVQRSVITLNLKQVDFDITYIDLADKPDWFLKISPFGKVPVLRKDDGVLFESAVINEYLDETNGESLHPSDPWAKAQNRAWIEFGSGLLMAQYHLTNAESEVSWWENWDKNMNMLQRLEDQLGDGPFFNGADFSLVETAYAPAMMRYDIIARRAGYDFLEKTPKVKAWSAAMLELDAVKKSVVDDFEDLYIDYLKKKDGYLASKI